MSLQFLPWSRRGLAAELNEVDGGGALPANASFDVTVAVNSSETTASVTTFGPGDVTGLDTAEISRIVPGRYAIDVAPDEFAAVEFDQPDLPWMFTPARPDADERLRPWLVLVVVAKADGVSIGVDRTKPLPILTIEAPAVPADELPDLAQSWAWAHTQLITADTNDDPVVAIGGRPEHNLSRIVCPRRLAPGTSYFAALVPAFDLGVDAGLGRPASDATTEANPAWTDLGDQITLPVYYHWEFTTGPAGDFESLARKLQPMAVPDGVGETSLFIGAAHRALPPLPADDGGVVMLEGALRAPESGSGADLDNRHRAYVDRLAELVNETAEAAGGTTTTGESVAPPVYGEWHVDHHQIPDRGRRPRWLGELNRDPRHRATAGLGTVVVQAKQEEYVDAAWAQVGDVVAANSLLARTRLLAAVADRLYQRHIVPLDAIRVVQLTAPAHLRLKLDRHTLATTMRRSAVLDGFESRSMRRLASPRGPVLRSAMRRVNPDLNAERLGDAAPIDGLAGAFDGTLTATISAVPDGIRDLAADALLEVAEVPDAILSQVTDLSREVSRRSLDEARPPTQIRPRADLARGGVIERRHIELLRTDPSLVDLPTLTAKLRSVARSADTDAISIVLTDGTFSPVKVDGGGRLTVPIEGYRLDIDIADLVDISDRLPPGRAQPGGGRIVLGRNGPIERRPPGRVGRDDAPVVSRGGARATTPPAMIDVTANVPIGPVAADSFERLPTARRRETIANIDPVRLGELVAERAPDGVTPIVLDKPTAAPRVVNAVIEAIAKQRDRIVDIDRLVPAPVDPVPLDAEQLRSEIIERMAPRSMATARVAERVRVAGGSLTSHPIGRLTLHQPEPVAQIMVGPVLDRPLYLDLKDYDQSRLLPGATTIPDNAITMVETNPRFVEAFMVGANHEFNRELLWRRYPADRRGTAFRAFWDRFDGGDDIEPIHTWRSASALGDNSAGDNDGSVVLLVRGQLLRRYPNTVVYAVAATSDRRIDTSADIELPVFAGFLNPDITFVGFDFDVDDARAGHGKMFVLQEQPTEPRFGLDVPSGGERVGPPDAWSNLTWGHVGTEPGGFLDMSVFGGRPSRPLITGGSVDAAYGVDAGQLAAITFQRPFRAAVHASEVLDA